MKSANVLLDPEKVREVVVRVGEAINSDADFRLPETAGGVIACLAVLAVSHSGSREEAEATAQEWARTLSMLTRQNFDKQNAGRVYQ